MIKSPFAPLVRGVKDLDQYQQMISERGNDRPVTVADLFSYSRIPLALLASKMLLEGKRPVTPVVVAMAVTDFLDGFSAREIDKRWPDSRLGGSAHGMPLDTYMDTAGVGIVLGATLRAPRVSFAGKLAAGSILGVETKKSIWAVKSKHEYDNAVKEHSGALAMLHMDDDDFEMPDFSKFGIPASAEGKAAMAEKLFGTVIATATNDVDGFWKRRALDAGALAFAGLGSVRGEKARQEYEEIAGELIQVHFDAAQEIYEEIAAA
jgi:hypothetical protein